MNLLCNIATILNHKRVLYVTGFFTCLVLLLVAAGNVYVGTFDQFVLQELPKSQGDHKVIGLVFGSGVTPEGRPFKELQARLDTAAEALEQGAVSTLILSGDNRFENYNEPQAMIRYLVEEKSIDESRLQADYAGRSTYETCERAARIFSVQHAILFSANSHLPRAIFTCRSFGIESYGYGNAVEANNATRREILARMKALFNVYLIGEQTILGEQIPLTY